MGRVVSRADEGSLADDNCSGERWRRVRNTLDTEFYSDIYLWKACNYQYFFTFVPPILKRPLNGSVL